MTSLYLFMIVRVYWFYTVSIHWIKRLCTRACALFSLFVFSQSSVPTDHKSCKVVLTSDSTPSMMDYCLNYLETSVHGSTPGIGLATSIACGLPFPITDLSSLVLDKWLIANVTSAKTWPYVDIKGSQLVQWGLDLVQLDNDHNWKIWIKTRQNKMIQRSMGW